MATAYQATGGRRRTYLPAAGHDWFLPLYDPFVKLVGGDRARRALLEQAGVRSGQRVLDVGCGTGTLAVLIKRLHPDVDVVGLDPDPKALARARRKAEREAVSIRLDRGFSDELPYSAASFDLVFSSLMFHHLSAEEKGPTLREIRRVLRPGGFLHLLDFGGRALRVPRHTSPHRQLRALCGAMPRPLREETKQELTAREREDKTPGATTRVRPRATASRPATSISCSDRR